MDRLTAWIISYNFSRTTIDEKGEESYHDSFTENQWRDAYDIFIIELNKFRASIS